MFVPQGVAPKCAATHSQWVFMLVATSHPKEVVESITSILGMLCVPCMQFEEHLHEADQLLASTSTRLLGPISMMHNILWPHHPGIVWIFLLHVTSFALNDSDYPKLALHFCWIPRQQH